MYKCTCGKEFKNSQAFNGHKSHCKVHQLIKYGNLDKVTANEKRFQEIGSNANKIKNEFKKIDELNRWISEKHLCEHCGKIMEEKFGSGRFCSRSCANSRVQTDEINTKRSKTLVDGYNLDKYKSHKLTKDEYYKNPKICMDCGEPIEFERRYYDTCESCSKIRRVNRDSKAGRSSAKVQAEKRRSKNEIYFYELCKNYFKNVRHNEPIFNGWDADIIIDDIKYAVLWNGKWHYSKITKNHSVKQVQNRDNIKINEIIKSGYTPYIIKDMGKYNKQFVLEQFDIFIDKIAQA